MSGLFYSLGRIAGPHVRKIKWAWLSASGSDAEAVQAEYEVGRDIACEIRRQLPLELEPRAVQLLNETGAKLSSHVANKLRTFNFEAVGGSTPNAFALPGGFIFVTRSLLELCEWNQDETAFILGHEMSHVIRGHAMERLINSSAIALGAKAAPIGGLIGGWVQKAGVKFLQNAYSQDMELEADTLGALLLDAAGYDTIATIQLLSRLAKLHRPAGQFDLDSYFSSHPAFELRIQHAKHVLEK